MPGVLHGKYSGGVQNGTNSRRLIVATWKTWKATADSIKNLEESSKESALVVEKVLGKVNSTDEKLRFIKEKLDGHLNQLDWRVSSLEKTEKH